jgi:hypothetical protein
MKSKRNLFEPVGIKPVLKEERVEIPRNDWRDKYPEPEKIVKARLENTPDDSELNRMIQFRNIENTRMVGGKPGTVYFDKANKKVKIFIDGSWVDVVTNPVP